MISNVNDFLISFGTSIVPVILLKVTATTTVALIGAQFARRSRAAVRHLLLLAAFAALLTLPVISVLAPSMTIAVPIRTPAPSVSLPALETPVDTTFSIPTVEPDGPATQQSSHGQTWPTPSVGTILLATWGLGAAALLLPIVVGLWQVRSLRRAGLPWLRGRALVGSLAADGRVRRHVEVVLHENVPGPMTCGLLRPTIILPCDAETWAAADLQRAMVHELEHVRRGDWISQCLARAACAAYWFHPLVWIAWRQLTLEAERACDDAVLQSAEATAYADQLVALAKRLSGATRTPVLAMANRHDLAARVTAVLDRRQPRGRAGALRVAAVCVTSAIAVAIVSPLRMVAATEESSVQPGETVATIPPGARSSRVSVPSSTSLGQGPSRVSPAAAAVLPQEPKPLSNATPKFDVVSVKPCAPDAPHAGRGGSPPVASPGRLHYDCYPLSTLMQEAYLSFAGGHINPTWAVVAVGWTGEPKWTKSDRFAIEATTKDSVPPAVMRGPMLQALLEDRFKLRVHRETRPMPVYELTVAKTGAKLTPFTPGSCVPFDWSVWPPRPIEASEQACRSSYHQDGTNMVRTFEGMPLDQIASLLGGFDRPIVNKTGISGLVGFRLVYEREESTGDQAPPPAFVRALKDQLGLELHPAMGTRDFIVVDHAEPPTPNDAPASQAATFNPQTATSPQAPQFEVVSIKPTTPFGPPLIQLVGDRWTAPHPGVGLLVQLAYDVTPAQIVGLPTWTQQTPFRIEAKLSANASAKDLPLMLQSMLADRFRLIAHRESRTLKVRTITIAKEGLKLRPATGACSTDPAEDLKTTFKRRRCGEMVESADFPNYTYGVIYRGLSVSMADIAAYFSRYSDTLFVDDTGLKGLYDVEVKLDETPPSDMDPGEFSDEQTAYRKLLFHKGWQEQAGLVLDARADRVVPVLVIDRLERPTPNGPVAVLK